jgi:hypothetical protein
MDARLGVENWDSLTPEERIAYCRKMAEEALASAEQVSVDLREGHIELASQWNLLAAELQNGRAPARFPPRTPNRDRL